MTDRLITADDLLARGSPWRGCELWDGLPVVREPSGGRAEEVGSRIHVPLAVYVRKRGLGWVFMSSQGFLLDRQPDRVLAADTAYVSRRRLPRLPAHGFVALAPDFCIEVTSPGQQWEDTVEKCGVWIAHGTTCAWAIDPDAHRVAVLRPGRAAVVRDRGGTLDAAPALPGFTLVVAPLFEGL